MPSWIWFAPHKTVIKFNSRTIFVNSFLFRCLMGAFNCCTQLQQLPRFSVCIIIISYLICLPASLFRTLRFECGECGYAHARRQCWFKIYCSIFKWMIWFWAELRLIPFQWSTFWVFPFQFFGLCLRAIEFDRRAERQESPQAMSFAGESQMFYSILRICLHPEEDNNEIR